MDPYITSTAKTKMTVTLAVPIREDIDEVIDRVTSALLTLTDETGEHLETSKSRGLSSSSGSPRA